MRNDKFARSFVFSNRTGCLLPSLIVLNLLFGWIFLKPLYWFLAGAVLLSIYIINGYIITRKIISASSGKHHNAIDVEASVIEDKHCLK